MITGPDRIEAIQLIKEAIAGGARETLACKEIGISQRTLQRWRSDLTPLEDQRPLAERPTPKNKLSELEKETILQTVNQPEYKSLPPSQIVPRLADQGVYIASESTFYRVLKKTTCSITGEEAKSPIPNQSPRIVQQLQIKSGCGILRGYQDRPRHLLLFVSHLGLI